MGVCVVLLELQVSYRCRGLFGVLFDVLFSVLFNVLFSVLWSSVICFVGGFTVVFLREGFDICLWFWFCFWSLYMGFLTPPWGFCRGCFPVEIGVWGVFFLATTQVRKVFLRVGFNGCLEGFYLKLRCFNLG